MKECVLKPGMGVYVDSAGQGIEILKYLESYGIPNPDCLNGRSTNWHYGVSEHSKIMGGHSSKFIKHITFPEFKQLLEESQVINQYEIY